MIGDSTRFTRQDGIEETWRVMQPLLDAPPPVQPYAPGHLGAGGRRRHRRRVRGLAHALAAELSPGTVSPDTGAPRPQPVGVPRCGS